MPSVRLWIAALALAVVPWVPAAQAAVKPALAKALALIGTTEPICWVDGLDGAEEVDAECPDGTYKDDNNPYCYYPCSKFDNTPVQGVKYANSTQNDDHCIPSCPPSMGKLKATTSAVTCFSCPKGYSAVPNKGCYTQCGVANTSTAGYPDPVNWTKAPVCGQSCAVLYPGTFNKPSKTDPNKCVDASGNTKTRLTKSRALVNPAKTLRVPVLPRSEEEMECKGSDPYSLYWDDTPPDEPHNGCYKCPPGQVTALYKTEWVYCMPAGCPDRTYTRCGHYCWSNALDAIMGPVSEDDCVTFLSTFDCLPTCFEKAPDPPAAKKKKAPTAAAAVAPSRPQPKLTCKDSPTKIGKPH